MFEDAARLRARESHHLAEGGLMCGAVYLAGYVVELKLKTLLTKQGRPFPRSGLAGHDLRGLWDSAGLRAADLGGRRRAFLDFWSTSVRYSAIIESQHSPEDLLRGAQELAGYVNTRILHAKRGKRGG